MSEVVFLSAVFLLLIGAIGFYLYSRLAYTDRKMNYMESMLIDMRMRAEMEKHQGHPQPPLPPMKNPEPLTEEDAEEISDEKAFYNSVIDSVANEEAVAAPVEKPVEDATNVVPSSAVDYESMTRDEVAAIAEKKSLRVTKRMQKAAIVNLLRESEKNTSAMSETGKDGGAPTGTATPFPMEGSGSGAPISLGTPSNSLSA
jgi:hypothetical protein